MGPLTAEMGTIDTATANLNSNEKLLKEVQCLVGGTSEKFVPSPTITDILTDVIRGLGDFKNRARWAEFWHESNKLKDKERQLRFKDFYRANPSYLSPAAQEQAAADPDFVYPDPWATFQENKIDEKLGPYFTPEWSTGLGTGLKPEHSG